MTAPQMSPKQLQELRVGVTGGNFATIYSGAIRAGKSFVWLLLLLIKVHQWDEASGLFVIVGKNRDSIYRNVFEPLMNNPVMRAASGGAVHYTQGAPTATILGKTIHVIGANDDRAESRIRGATVAYAFVDEVTVIPEGFFRQLLGRLSVAGAQLFGTTNPDSPAHWLKREYIDRLNDLPGWRVTPFVMDDNPSLTEEYKRQQAAANRGLFYRRNIKGEWVAAEGAIYDAWNPDVHVVPYEAVRPLLSHLVSIGLDYGTTHATAALLLGMTGEREPRLVLLDEWRVEVQEASARWTDAMLSRGFKEWRDSIESEHKLPAPSWVFADHAAASYRVQLSVDGVPTQPAEKDVKYGIGLVSSLLGSGRLLVTDRCEGLIREAPSYVWDPKAALLGEDKPVKVADDSLDAARYAITTSEKFWRQYIDIDDTYRPRMEEAAA